MQTMRSDIAMLMERLTFPAEAREVLLSAFDRVAESPVAAAWWNRLVARYEATEKCNYPAMIEDVRALADTLSIHRHTLEMLLFLALGKKLRARYAERGIDESIYYDSLMDLRYKLEECRLVHGTVGSFVSLWFSGFYTLARFALGRLQFEMTTLKAPYTVGGETLPEGSKAINIHIPRTGTRLYHDEVLASYRRAAETFADAFGDAPILFTCHSWMLDPWHAEVLAPESNMVQFLRDFALVERGDYDDYKEAWRLFDCLVGDDPDVLPADTTLRRAYVEKMRRGQPTSWGRGVFIWRDGKIFN